MRRVTVVVGYVPRPEGRAALEAGIAEARRRGEDLYVLNTSKGGSLADASYAPAADIEDVHRVLEASGLAYELDQDVTGRDGADDVVAAAEARDTSVIVIGIRRRTATGKLITGSDAQRILLTAACPVLAVKADDG